MKVIVLGAGVVGVSSAWYLHQAGHEVVVIDRQPASGLETSFANAGQISVSHAEPWANPHAPAKILKWLGREDAPLLFRPRLDARQWAWGMRFLYECLPGRTRENTLQILRFALYSRSQLQALRQQIDIRYDHLERGILHLHADESGLRAASAHVDLLRKHGFDMQVLSKEQCIEVEPALKYSNVTVAGGTYAASDESGDAHIFTRRLEEAARSRGVQYAFQHTVLSLQHEAGRITGVRVRDLDGAEEVFHADAYLSCVGVATPFLMEPLGVLVTTRA
jgi:D-amino-acid dehydrogenase